MSTITIENAPNELGKKISYEDYFIIPRERLKNPKQLSELFYNEHTDSYGTFEGEEAINFLKLLDYEDGI